MSGGLNAAHEQCEKLTKDGAKQSKDDGSECRARFSGAGSV
jgi:hypothetical protein